MDEKDPCYNSLTIFGIIFQRYNSRVSGLRVSGESEVYEASQEHGIGQHAANVHISSTYVLDGGDGYVIGEDLICLVLEPFTESIILGLLLFFQLDDKYFLFFHHLRERR